MSDGELHLLFGEELLCIWCQASFAVGPPNALFCDECRAILANAVTDWHDDEPASSPPAVDADRPAA